MRKATGIARGVFEATKFETAHATCTSEGMGSAGGRIDGLATRTSPFSARPRPCQCS